MPFSVWLTDLFFFQLSDPKTSDRYLVSSRSWFHISPGWKEFAGIFWQDRTETKNSTSPSSLSVFCRRAHTGKGKKKKEKSGVITALQTFFLFLLHHTERKVKWLNWHLPGLLKKVCSMTKRTKRKLQKPKHS